MARQFITPFIPKTAENVEVGTRSRDLASIISSAAGLGVGIASNVAKMAEEDKDKNLALIKLHNLSREEGVKQTEQQQRLDIANSNFATQKSNAARVNAEKAISDVERLEKNSYFAAVAILPEDQLKTASASNLGFRTPAGMAAVSQAIGRRRADIDLPELQNRIASDFSKTGSQHLKEYLNDNALEDKDANMYYASTLTSAMRDNIASRIRNETKIAAENNEYLAFNEISRWTANNFDIASEESVLTMLGEKYQEIGLTNPNMTYQEFINKAASSMEPVLVGRESTIPPEDVVDGLANMFDNEEQIIEAGFGRIYGIALNQVATREENRVSKIFDTAKDTIEFAPSHALAKAFNDQYQSSEDLGPLQKAKLQKAYLGVISGPDYGGDVGLALGQPEIRDPKSGRILQQKIIGDPNIVITEGHDSALESATHDRMIGDPNYTTIDALRDQSKVGYITKNQIAGIVSADASGNILEAVDRAIAIRDANPSTFRRIESQLPERTRVLSNVALAMGSQASEYFARADLGSVEGFNKARAIIDNGKDEDGKKLFDSTKESITDLAKKTVYDGVRWGPIPNVNPKSIIMDASVSDLYDSFLTLGMAQAIADSGGNLTPQQAWELGKDFADTSMKNNVKHVRIGDETFLMSNLAVIEYGFDRGDTQYQKGVSELWAEKQHGLEDAYGFDVRLDFARAEPKESEDGVWNIHVPVVTRDYEDRGKVLVVDEFVFPRSNSYELDILLSAKRQRDKEIFEKTEISPFDFIRFGGGAFDAANQRDAPVNDLGLSDVRFGTGVWDTIPPDPSERRVQPTEKKEETAQEKRDRLFRTGGGAAP